MSSPNQRKIYKGFDNQINNIEELQNIMFQIGDSKAWTLWFYLYSLLNYEEEILFDASDFSKKMGLGEKALKNAWDKLQNSKFLSKTKTNTFLLLTTKTTSISYEEKWSVYEHIFPNSKRYIGIAKDPKSRFANGEGYRGQLVYEPIKFFGWENIKHNIVKTGLSKSEALMLERQLIKEYQTITNGYNAI